MNALAFRWQYAEEEHASRARGQRAAIAHRALLIGRAPTHVGGACCGGRVGEIEMHGGGIGQAARGGGGAVPCVEIVGALSSDWTGTGFDEFLRRIKGWRGQRVKREFKQRVAGEGVAGIVYSQDPDAS